MRAHANRVARFRNRLALVIGLLLAGMTSRALAVEVVPDSIEFYPSSIAFGSQTVGYYILIQSAGVNYFAANQVLGDTCAGQAKPMDTLRNWLSLSQSALLSGKKVSLGVVVCNNLNFITTIALRR